MIIVKAPLRITLGGGGTDLPEWYKKHGGFLISAAISKYIFFTGCERPFDKKLWLSYSKVEVTSQVNEVNHEILRKCLEKYELPRGVEIHSISEVAGNSGLGSSGAFTVGTITLLNSLNKIEMSRTEVAELACKIEMQELGKASGKQDQYISALGGILTLTIDRDGKVKAEKLRLPLMTIKRLETNLLIYSTGMIRESNEILKEQSDAVKASDSDITEAMHEIQKIGYLSRDAIIAGELDELGCLMHSHWVVKNRISKKMSNSDLDQTYDFALKEGALGGKIMGAGGGGYWAFYVPPEKQLSFRLAMEKRGLVELDWNIEADGCGLVYSG